MRTSTTERLKTIQKANLMPTEKDLQRLYKFRLIEPFEFEPANEERAHTNTPENQQPADKPNSVNKAPEQEPSLNSSEQ